MAKAAAAGDLSAGERAALAGQPASDVAALRAGASAPVSGMAEAERVALSRAEASSGDLDMLRAVDDHDLELVAVVLGIVILAILIF
jgi:hypothetical protein